jgi:DNA-binding MarR family transcriptional regulator
LSLGILVDFVTNNRQKQRMSEKDEFDLQLFLPYLLNQAAEASSLGFTQVYKDRYGMLRTEWRVLFHLGIYGTLTAKEIGKRARTHKTKISRAVAALEERRYLKRTRLDSDRRVEALELTAQGMTIYNELRTQAQQFDKALADQMSPEERDVLKKLLLRLSGL